MKFLKALSNFATSWTGAIIIVLFVVFFIAQGFVIPSRSMVGTLFEGDMLFVKKFSYGIILPKIPWIEVRILPDFRGNGHLIDGERPKRGDIVVFNPPGEDKQYFVKRNFANGGDKVIFARDGMYLRPFEGDGYIKEHFKDYYTRYFFGEMYVKEPYSREFKGIHYGEVGYNIMPLNSFEIMKRRLALGSDNHSIHTHGIAMQPRFENGELLFYKEIEPDSFFMVGDNRDNSEDSRFWGSVPYAKIVGTPWFSYLSLTLQGSVEADAFNEPKNRYVLRWDRIFSSITTLQNMAREYEGECRYYSENPCIEVLAE
ncbi:signal peptidase I [Helicobacter saguini]|uniref:Signal peptidase I n=1 Tax=Helicobacter saguini TaxID=1548018 RepID=A0A347VU01_9HELI|nr:signal peptidase I [Helicobacter saguini]MWV61197.1 signal peptidase I [Helicobacter saguini]MWV68136.1 signal peptidase I [Helicobacter saguini]MWV70401.1 signal peptidase I [Helicobacter saguini]MWV72302.1 signal peptidase I [Helicobacter saguini]TLD95367.1 signal peptidase I [Helicobacter saguini]